VPWGTTLPRPGTGHRLVTSERPLLARRPGSQADSNPGRERRSQALHPSTVPLISPYTGPVLHDGIPKTCAARKRQGYHPSEVSPLAIQVAVPMRPAKSSPVYASIRPAPIDIHRHMRNGRSGLIICRSRVRAPPAPPAVLRLHRSIRDCFVDRPNLLLCSLPR
jgi:hypothetical protein